MASDVVLSPEERVRRWARRRLRLVGHLGSPVATTSLCGIPYPKQGGRRSRRVCWRCRECERLSEDMA